MLIIDETRWKPRNERLNSQILLIQKAENWFKSKVEHFQRIRYNQMNKCIKQQKSKEKEN